MRFWALHQRLAELDQKLRLAFVFTILSEDIGDANWPGLEAIYKVTLEKPPDPTLHITFAREINTGSGAGQIIELVAPPGYDIDPQVNCRLSYWGAPFTEPLLNISDSNWRSTLIKHAGSGSGDGWYEFVVQAFGGNDRRTIQIIAGTTDKIFASFNFTARRREDHFRAWQLKAWVAPRDTALAQHNDTVARTQEERDRLWRLLNGKDTLTLRRLEREELMRLVMQWLLGPDYPVVASPGDPRSRSSLGRIPWPIY